MKSVRIGIPAALAAAALVLTACGDTGDAGSAKILPHSSPIILGDFYPQGNEEADVASKERTPYEFVLLLLSEGDGTLEIDEACIVGDDGDNFILEGPKPSSVAPGDEGAVRVTYRRTEPNPGGNPDNIAVVVQSNASDFPTLVVPFCARVIPDGSDKSIFECDSPVTVPKGEKDDSLCE